MDACEAGALLLAHRPIGRTLFVVGSGKLAGTRIGAAHAAGMRAVVAWEMPAESEHTSVADERIDVPHELLFPTDQHACAVGWGRLLDTYDTDRSLFAVCVTDTLAPNASLDTCRLRCEALARACRERRLFLNVADQPDLCDFSFPATHRFTTSNGAPSALQIAVATNGRGCRLAGRIRRKVVSALPACAGEAVDRIGVMREFAKKHDDAHARGLTPANSEDDPATVDSLGYADEHAAQRHRMRWVAQISEYWPFEHLAALDEPAMHRLLEMREADASAGREAADMPASFKRKRTDSTERDEESRHELSLAPAQKMGRVYLLGSGPGHPGLLTVAAHKILTSSDTDLILSDKLVPTAVLALIPPTTPLVIAKKFPGNAEGAQSELIVQATEAARAGKKVVRLKQGDPYVYGRGGEELVAFRLAGIPCTVVPGISSALAGPLLMDIPVTQRGAAESLVLCTGVGRGGKRVYLPGYERARTLIVLMGVARLRAVIETLTSEGGDGRNGASYPGYVPIAIIERASSSDQRMIASTLDRIVDVVEQKITDGQRPPSMMVVGWAVLSLAGDVAGNHVLDDEVEAESAEQLADKDYARVSEWLGSESFRVHEGISEGYRLLDMDVGANMPIQDRSETGWSAPRYGTENDVRGGWTAGEDRAVTETTQIPASQE